MANNAKTGTLVYSGVTTTTDTDVLTLTGFSPGIRGGAVGYLDVRNRHASAILYVRTDGTSPAATAPAASSGNAVVAVPAGAVARVYPNVRATGTVEVRLTGSAACDYTVVALKPGA
jgi:hypothetical protein